jgi:chromosomal replication initiation ATPase DnaA
MTTTVIFGDKYFYRYNIKTDKETSKIGKNVKTVITTSHPHTTLENFIEQNSNKKIYVFVWLDKNKDIYWKTIDIAGNEIGKSHILRAVTF